MNDQKYIPALKFYWLTNIYDCLISLFMPEKKFKQALINNANIKSNFSVLDFGVGTATLSILAFKTNSQAYYKGVDIDEKILDIARNKITKEKLPIDLFLYNGGKLPFETESIDRVISSLVFHHLTDEQKTMAFSEIKRILKSNGELHIADWGKPSNRLMRWCFHLVQFLDGYKTTEANVKGLLPNIILKSGFSNVEINNSFNTLLGTIEIFKAV